MLCGSHLPTALQDVLSLGFAAFVIVVIRDLLSVSADYVPKKIRKPPWIPWGELLQETNKTFDSLAHRAWRHLFLSHRSHRLHSRDSRARSKREPTFKHVGINARPAPYLWHASRRVLMLPFTRKRKRKRIYRVHRRGHLRLIPLAAFMAEALPNGDSDIRPGPCTTDFTTGSFPIRVDSHCSYCMTNDINDFEGPMEPIRATVTGLGNRQMKVALRGTAVWSWEDDQGRVTTHRIPGTIYAPDQEGRLLSPQHWAQTRARHDGDHTAHVTTSSEDNRLSWGGGEFVKTVPLLRRTNVSVMHSASRLPETLAAFPSLVSDDEGDDVDDSSPGDADASPAAPPLFDATNVPGGENAPDVTEQPRSVTFSTEDTHIIPQETLDAERYTEETKSPHQLWMHWHQRLNHLGIGRMLEMAKSGLLPKCLLKIRPPKCSACLLGKATRRPWRTKGPIPHIKTPNVNGPGDCVSVDQLQSTSPGLIGQLKGFITKRRYHYATIFVDHYSSLSFVFLQETSNMEETLKAKAAFESFCAKHGVVVKHWHADNGRFAENGWLNSCTTKQQTISFCGVNAHHQNGYAERRIRDLQEASRTALIGAKRRWPDAINEHLWPYALRAACHTHNCTVSKVTNKIPMHEFSQVEDASDLKHFHSFGCPVYVLDGELQQGNRRTQHKWNERARIGVNLGPSPKHGKSVHLVLNLLTGFVSPQFHMVFDDSWDTTRRGSDAMIPKSLWQQRTYFVEQRTETTSHLPISDQQSVSARRSSGTRVRPSSAGDRLEEPAPEIPTAPVQPPTVTRSGRVIMPPQRLIESYTSVANFDHLNDLSYQDEHPLVAYKATSDPDTLYLHEAMAAPDRKQFLEAMLKEVRDHEDRGHWVLVPMSEVPKGQRVLPSVWSMKRKRHIKSQEVYKWKSRLNVGGHKQIKDIDYDLTYSPVIAWPTIRLMLAWCVLNGWITQQLDLVLAYPHADVERPTYMKLPQGFKWKGRSDTHCLKMIKNLYGQRQASRVYFQFLAKYLTKTCGFKQSTVDPCVFYGVNCILLVYVDDLILCAKSQEDMDNAVELMKDNLDLEEKGDLADYLGVNIERKDDHFVFTQPHLIKSILKDLRLDSNSRSAATPALVGEALHADLEGEDHDDHFNYRSVMGKLNYLTKCSRPDLGYAVNACARFMSNPKKSHAIAVKRIGRYLLRTADKGFVIKPDKSKSFECYVDASFAGEWVKHKADLAMVDPNTARSRTGFVILFAGVPLIWSACLQQTVVLSSCEAELVALSAATRECIFLLRLIDEAKKQANIDINLSDSKIHCKVFEDNQGAIEVAKEFRLRPRTRHINVKYWHFALFMKEHEGIMSINWIDTKNQLADALTKSTSIELFNKFTENICGWIVPGTTTCQENIANTDYSSKS